MKILSIGNSFSQDAQRYLHNLAKFNGDDIKCVNLFISGCPLKTHYINSLEDAPAYDFEFNGQKTGIKVSIKQALISDEWDYVTLQQASRFSFDFDTYIPYIEEVYAYVKKYAPKSKILIHQTWGYADGSAKLIDLNCFENYQQMFEGVFDAYDKAYKHIKADGLIPSGKAMYNALNLGIGKIHRDGYHATFGAGRYLLALCWYKFLTGKDISNDKFNEFDEKVTRKEREIVINAVNEAFK